MRFKTLYNVPFISLTSNRTLIGDCKKKAIMEKKILKQIFSCTNIISVFTNPAPVQQPLLTVEEGLQILQIRKNITFQNANFCSYFFKLFFSLQLLLHSPNNIKHFINWNTRYVIYLLTYEKFKLKEKIRELILRMRNTLESITVFSCARCIGVSGSFFSVFFPVQKKSFLINNTHGKILVQKT